MIGHSDLGLHRIGLFATRHPKIAWPILCVALFLAIFGVSNLKTDASLTKAFHSGTPEYHTYQKLTSTFPGSEHDIFVLVQGPNLFKSEVLAALQELHFELPLIDHVQSAASIFALRQSVATSPDPDPLIPEQVPQTQAELDELERAILTHPMARQRLLSPRTSDGQLTIFAVSIDPEKDDAKLRSQLIGEVTEISKQLLQPLQLKFTIGGVPIARQELLQATKTDAKVFSALGFLVGLIIGAFVFRRWQFVIVASACPLIAIVAGVGTIGLFGGLYSPFMNGIPPLIMAIAFTDCMHLLFAIRGNAQAGMPVEQAVQRACEEVGPACGIASLTTAAALLSLALAPSPLVQQFGLWAAAAAIVAVCIVFLALPLLSLIAFRGMPSTETTPHLDSFALLARGCRRLGRFVKAYAFKISIVSLLLTMVLAATYYALEPRYRLSDQVPINGSFRVVNTTLDRFIGGSGPVYVVVRWDPKSAPSDTKLFRAVSAAHAVLQAASPGRNVLSLKSLGSGFPDAPDASEAQSVEAMTLFRSDVQSRLLQRARGGALVSVLLPDINADEMAPFAASVDQALGTVRQQHPEFSFVVTS
ncbi:MAG: MMPL family transporter, partial [Rhizobiales bacterium]|nr:MMPL family transporter [Hyphomicrobiales bacterium]